ncbi:MAG: type II toxin-antitoxin system PemK/MazF family toxin [Caldilineaceae bacterium]|nr:type II toxin-antitoxin system PemK/MazF family toxin [Caldilineaceae bacterium]MCB0095514.1 type II toxin-antitoxin system PemK/MazF family toxin [Caldilineaceae bacterium]MCB0144978.1 type II toxin-antitoxin system PemK/MazF family toxin [Caldilineaceae bacterium]MCB9156829.1 type II toxin-antitoxin system PemK/MazF family toxin [Caldilineaceae bacterium]
MELLCAITSQIKGYRFEVQIPEGSKVSGVVLADQVKSLDWRARNALFICKLPDAVVHEVMQKVAALIG